MHVLRLLFSLGGSPKMERFAKDEGKNRKLLVSFVLWMVGWNILAWVGNIRLRRGQTAISIAKTHTEYYQSGMRDVIAGAQLERLALACELGAIAFGAFLLLRPWILSRTRRQKPVARQRVPSVPAKEPCELESAPLAPQFDVRRVEWPIGEIPSFESVSLRESRDVN